MQVGLIELAPTIATFDLYNILTYYFNYTTPSDDISLDISNSWRITYLLKNSYDFQFSVTIGQTCKLNTCDVLNHQVFNTFL